MSRPRRLAASAGTRPSRFRLARAASLDIEDDRASSIGSEHQQSLVATKNGCAEARGGGGAFSSDAATSSSSPNRAHAASAISTNRERLDEDATRNARRDSRDPEFSRPGGALRAARVAAPASLRQPSSRTPVDERLSASCAIASSRVKSSVCLLFPSARRDHGLAFRRGQCVTRW